MIGKQIGFIGGGNMATAIARGLVRAGVDPDHLSIGQPGEAKRAALLRNLPGTNIVADNALVADKAEVLVLAIKPQILPAVCKKLQKTVQLRKPLVISVAAGIRCADIERWLGGNLSIVRAMPNTPALLDLGMSALFANEQAGDDERAVAEDILRAVGKTVWLNSENHMDAATAISGTGPAYFYLMIDMLIKAGINFGLDESTAKLMAVETAKGAAAVAGTEPEAIASLIDRVRSPAGTTDAAFASLDGNNFRDIFAVAVAAANDRAASLAAEARAANPT
jgi:pyrroline-5-carboxylate reductase